MKQCSLVVFVMVILKFKMRKVCVILTFVDKL